MTKRPATHNPTTHNSAGHSTVTHDPVTPQLAPMNRTVSTERRGRFWSRSPLATGGTIVAAITLTTLALTGLPSCDSTAKFSLPERKFIDVQVVTAFPANIADDGSITRVCGRPLENETAMAANGLEFNVNFVSTELKKPLCANDRDQGIKEGELIELYRVQSTGKAASIGPNNFQLSLSCMEPRGPIGTACSTGIKGDSITPSTVLYKNEAQRCDPSKEASRINVALLLDHSGSVSGFIDKNTFKEDNPAKLQPPDSLIPSDKFNSRIQAAERFVESLNDRDRLIGYYFNEKLGVTIAGDDNLGCLNGAKSGKRCLTDADCGANSDGCFANEATDGNSFDVLSLGDQQAKAFGSTAATRSYLLTALNNKVKYKGAGRSNLWDGIDTAYAHLKVQKVSGPRHIVVLTDGPETCTDGEDFVYVGSDGKCRTPCLSAQQSFTDLRKRMQADAYPVILHFVQFQSKGYQEPSAKLQELACRTGGTYQFINTQEMNLEDAPAISGAMTRAMTRIRYTLSGSWRVGVRLNPIKDPNLVKTGKLFAADGLLRFENKRFPSLDIVNAESRSWKFGVETGNEDRRVLFRKGCKTAADCGGTDECGANHCTEDGLCVSTNAPDRLPCGGGTGQVCCSGVCSKDCTAACK